MYLSAHSYFSLRFGTIPPEKLPVLAKEQGMSALVLTDINNTSCAYQFARACREQGIHPALGLDFRRDQKALYTGIALNGEGFYELNRLLSEASLQGKPLQSVPPLCSHAVFICDVATLPFQVGGALPENVYIGIRPQTLGGLRRSPIWKYKDRCVIWQPLTHTDGNAFKVHKLLRAVDLNTVLSKLTPADLAPPTDRLMSIDAYLAPYADFPEIIRNTEALLAATSVDFPVGHTNNRQTFTGDTAEDGRLLTKLALEGCRKRYGHRSDAAERTERELKVILQLGFAPYFLITWDIIRYAQNAGYHHVGRGSGANSIVAFNLGITDVDPIELDLYFERFINPYRTSPPDFDIDFSWDERDTVTDYIFKRYGSAHTALLCTHNTFKGRSIIRELGKVVGLPKADIDIIVEEPLNEQAHHPFAKHLFKYGAMLDGFPNYLSIHSGGVIISERPLYYYTALQMMPKGFPVTHFDMYGAEDFGFHKYDVLSQRGLGHIKEAVALVHANQGKHIDIHAVERIKKDPEVRKRLKSGRCIGCFYIESPAMRGLLHKLQCDTYVHLVAASSIIRPGVASSGMMRAYIERFHHPEKVPYIHPVFEEHLRETFGVMVYQEDVMKIVHHFAGLDLDESDILRRIMTGKKKSSTEFRRLQEKYFINCAARGYPPELIQEVWRQIESFSGYSFCKAHSASYAVESFQSLYLKTYYPLEFMVGVINNFGGFYNTELYVHEARMQGGVLHAPCVNRSQWLTHIRGKEIYLGFIHLHGMESRTGEMILSERKRGGEFKHLAEFCERVSISGEQLDLLIRIGAFRFTGINKYMLMWEKNAVFHPQPVGASTPPMFHDMHTAYSIPVLEEGMYDQAFDELELLGFPLCSPFDLLNETPPQKTSKGAHCILAQGMKQHAGKRVQMLGYFVARKHVTTVRKEHMNFGTWLDASGDFFDSAHFPQSLSRYPFKGKGVYLMSGRIALDFGFPMLEVETMERLPYVKDERY